MKKVIIIVVVVVAVVLVVGFVPLMEAQYRYTETYYEDEPYEVTETYTENVSVEMEILEHGLVRDFLLYVRGKVKHTGDQTLHWTDVTIWVEYEIEDLPGRTFNMPGGIDPIPATFKPGEIRDFSVLVEDGTTHYEITPPTTTKTLEKERIVTKYRQVEKERLVIQYRKVPIFEYLCSRF